MTDFKSKDDEHDYLTYLFDSDSAKEFSKHFKMSFTVVDGKFKDRVAGASVSYQETAKLAAMYCQNSLKPIERAKNQQDVVLHALGFPVEGNKIGVTICIKCIDRAIMHCEDLIGNLKEVKELVKSNVT